jgi:hypothetical protein
VITQDDIQAQNASDAVAVIRRQVRDRRRAAAASGGRNRAAAANAGSGALSAAIEAAARADRGSELLIESVLGPGGSLAVARAEAAWDGFGALARPGVVEVCTDVFENVDDGVSTALALHVAHRIAQCASGVRALCDRAFLSGLLRVMGARGGGGGVAAGYGYGGGPMGAPPPVQHPPLPRAHLLHLSSTLLAALAQAPQLQELLFQISAVPEIIACFMVLSQPPRPGETLDGGITRLRASARGGIMEALFWLAADSDLRDTMYSMERFVPMIARGLREGLEADHVAQPPIVVRFAAGVMLRCSVDPDRQDQLVAGEGLEGLLAAAESEDDETSAYATNAIYNLALNARVHGTLNTRSLLSRLLALVDNSRGAVIDFVFCCFISVILF